MEYGYRTKIPLPFPEAITYTKEALKKQGFGVLTEIDVRSTLKEKLGVKFDNYVILGACNPSLAHQALQQDREIGLLLPCNVIVYEQNQECFVAAILPSAAMSMVSNKQLQKIAQQAEERLKNVITSLNKAR